MVELGISTFGETTPLEGTGQTYTHDERIRQLVAEIELADKVGLDVYGIGEHHREDFAVSAPEIVLAAGAVKTEKIRLTSAVSVLSSLDPIRVYQQYATIDALSNGRAEVMAGRGSFIESFPLFDYDLKDYEELFDEKLDLLLYASAETRLNWKGKLTQTIENREVYPRAVQETLPVWVATGGNVESTIKVAQKGLPIAYAIIGGVAVIAIVAATYLGRTLTGASSSKASSSTSGSDKVTTLKVAHTQNYVPYDFLDEKGQSDGYEVAVLKAVDEKLPDYQFEYTGTSDEDLLIGLESGKYDIGTKGAWYTEERAKKFIIPESPIGASIIGFTIRKADANKFKNIDDFAKEKGKLVPISPQNAQWTVIEEYNKKHSASPIELTAAESFQIADAYAWVLEGRYDAFFDIKLSFEKAVTDKAGSYHQYADQLSWFPYKGIPTYPLIHKDKKNEEFAKAYEKAIKELEKDGTLSKLSEKYFGEDVFSYVDKD